jgi:hypothetical protein
MPLYISLNYSLTSLSPSTMYEATVLSVGDHSVSLPSPAVVFLTYSDPSESIVTTTRSPISIPTPIQQLRTCYRNQGIIPQCLRFCDYSLAVELSDSRDLVQSLWYLNQFLVCASDGRNHTFCCKRRGVRENCLGYCASQHSGAVSVNMQCLGDMPNMLACFKENALVSGLFPGTIRRLLQTEEPTSLESFMPLQRVRHHFNPT